MKKNRSILWQWTISYLTLIIIPILSIFITYYHNEKNLRQEYINAFELTLDNLNTVLDNYVADMKGYQNYIINTDHFNSMRNADVIDANFHYHSYKLQTALSLYTTANTGLNCAIYYDTTNFISASNTSCSADRYYSWLNIKSSLIPDFESWTSFITAHYTNDYFVSTSLSTDDNPCLVYARTFTRGEQKYSTIFVTVKLSKLLSLLKFLPDGTYYVLQSAGDQLCFFNNNGIVALAADDKPLSFVIREDGRAVFQEGCVSLASTNEHENLNCYLVFSEEVINTSLHGVRTNFYITLSLTLILCLFGILILLRTNYRPITALLYKFNAANTNRNEYVSLANSYDSLLNDYHAASLTVQHNKREIENSRLLSILKGRTLQNDWLTGFHSKIALISFMIHPTDQQKLEYDELIFFVIDNIFSELFEGYKFYHIEDGYFIFYLFDLEEPPADHKLEIPSSSWHDFAIRQVDYLCSLLNDKWNVPVVGAVSDIVENLNHCKFLYRQTMECFELQRDAGISHVIDITTQNAQNSDAYTLEMLEQELDAIIKEGNYNSALQLSEKIFSQKQGQPFSTQKGFIFDVYTLVINIFNQNITTPIHHTHMLDHIIPLIQASTVSEMKECLNKVLEYVCNEITQKRNVDKNNIVFKIQQYIEENYANQSLSVSSMADALNRNPRYMLRIFKETLGEGILDYINQYRIAKAKELMQSNQYTLSEISEMVGYANVQSFRRAFTKFTGELPSQYIK